MCVKLSAIMRRTKHEMMALDLKIRPLYSRGLGCRVIGKMLGENPVIVLRRVRSLGIARTREVACRAADIPIPELPFSKMAHTANLKEVGLGEAVRWFSERGYCPSIPLTVCRYDLVVESDHGLKRIQVKTTNEKEESGRWNVNIHRAAYDRRAVGSPSGGKRKRVAYNANEIDFFFILTGDGSRYLIPIAAVEGKKNLVLDAKYSNCKV